MGLEPTNLLTASQALYQLSYAPVAGQRSANWRSADRWTGFANTLLTRTSAPVQARSYPTWDGALAFSTQWYLSV